MLEAVLGDLFERLGIDTGPVAPAGVMARQVDASHALYLNLDGTTKSIELNGKARSILYDRNYVGEFSLGPYQHEFVESCP